MTTFKTKTETQTIELAKKLSTYLKPGMTVLLEGHLGAGKTTFTKGIGAGLGIKRIIKSPSYTIIREYQDGKFPLYHIDLYRLDESEAEYLGLEEYFEGNGITVVEWPSVAPDELPIERLEINLEIDLEQPDYRIITFNSKGNDYKAVIENLKKSV